MKFDRKILNKNGWDDWTDSELIQMLKDKINYLFTHNKNYTENQEIIIDNLKDIIESLKED